MPLTRLATGCAVLMLIAGSAAGQTPAPGRLTISSASADLVNQQLTVTGENFGVETPLVALDGIVLAVFSSNPTQIVAGLPPGLAASPGTYQLVVMRGPSVPASATFAVALGAVGPQGPRGDPGPSGAQGVQGVTGPAGPAGATGPAGASGPIGPMGPAGPLGPVGPAGPAGSGGGLSGWETISSGPFATGFGSSVVATIRTVPCPAGKKALGGGFAAELWSAAPVGMYVIASQPTGGTTSGWLVNIRRPATEAEAFNYFIWVVCATVQ